MKKTFSFVLALTLALGGCGTSHNSYEFNNELDRQVHQIADLRLSYHQRMQESALDPIRERISLSGSYPRVGTPCFGAATESYPTPAEKAALQRWAAERNDFLTKLALLARPTPNAPERLARFMVELDKANFEAAAEITAKIDDLSRGALTYCQFARAADAINRRAHRDTDGYRHTIDEELIIDAKLRSGFIPLKEAYY